MVLTIRSYATSLIVAVIVMALGVFTAFNLVNWSDTSSGSWWIGLVGVFMVAATLFAVWLAVSNKTSDLTGFVIVLGLLIIDAVLVGTYHPFRYWSWGQFWLGGAELVAVILATAVAKIHQKYL